MKFTYSNRDLDYERFFDDCPFPGNVIIDESAQEIILDREHLTSEECERLIAYIRDFEEG